MKIQNGAFALMGSACLEKSIVMFFVTYPKQPYPLLGPFLKSPDVELGRVYSPISTPEPGQPLYVCEGWATGATIHAETGFAVACAMNAGNLLEAGRQLQRLHPDSPLIIAGDDDRRTEAAGKGNAGREAATRAAVMLGCGLVLPPWSGAEPLSLSDFNDLASWRAAQ